jgi:anhydro-N-acetylmuramic acid kinase
VKLRRVVGCMTGTSLDGLDASLVEIEGEGLAMRARAVRSLSRGLGEVGPRLRAIAEQKPVTAAEIASVSRDFALLHASAILELLAGEKTDLVCVHGQTVFHKPPLSWQLMQPAPIAHAVGCPVVYDLRQADLAAGGQGAPITPIADWVLFSRHSRRFAVVNLGGFANVSQWDTLLYDEFPPETHGIYGIDGGDICACNQLLDAIARIRLERPYDEDGRVSLAGVMDDGTYARLRAALTEQNQRGRSLGTGDELQALISEFETVPTSTLLRSACEAIARVVVSRVGFEFAVAGGGTRNKGLMTALGSQLGHGMRTTADFGVPIEYREAICFAVLGALCQDRVPITIPAVTGVSKAPLSGAWVYP